MIGGSVRSRGTSPAQHGALFHTHNGVQIVGNAQGREGWAGDLLLCRSSCTYLAIVWVPWSSAL